MVNVGLIKYYFKQYGIIVVLIEMFVIVTAFSNHDTSIGAGILIGILAMSALGKREQNELLRSMPVTRNQISLTTICFVEIVFCMTYFTSAIIDMYNFKWNWWGIAGGFLQNQYLVLLAMLILVISGSLASAVLIALFSQTIFRFAADVIVCYANIFFGYKYNSQRTIAYNIDCILTRGYRDLANDFSSEASYFEAYMVCVLGMVLLIILMVFLFVCIYRRTEYYTKGFFSIKLTRKGMYIKNCILSSVIVMYITILCLYSTYLVENHKEYFFIFPSYITCLDGGTVLEYTEYFALTIKPMPVIGLLIIIIGVVSGIAYTKIRIRRRGESV